MTSVTSATEERLLNTESVEDLNNDSNSKHGKSKKSKGKDTDKKKENTVVADLATMNSGRPRRCVSKPLFFHHALELPKKKVTIEKPRIEIEVGEKPNIKPILRTNAKAKLTQELKSIKFFNKCAIQVIDPLDGWKDGVVRMPDDSDDNENRETRPLRSSDDMRLTPDSMRKLLSCERSDDQTPLSFNIFCEEVEEISIISTPEKSKEKAEKGEKKKVKALEKEKKKSKSRKRSIAFQGDLSLWAKKAKCSPEPDDQKREFDVLGLSEDSISSTDLSSSAKDSTLSNSQSEGSCSSVLTEENHGSGDCKENEELGEVVELDSSTEDLSGSFHDAVLLKDDISIREEVKKSLKLENKKSVILKRDFDRAPFSRYNVLSTPYEIKVDESWKSEFEKGSSSDINFALSEIVKKRMLSKLHSFSNFPVLRKERPLSSVFVSKADSIPDVIEQFTAEEKKWYDHACSCREDAEVLPWCEALQPKTTDVWLGSVVQAEKVKSFVKYWLKRGEKEAEESMKKKRLSYDCDSDYEEDGMDGGGTNPMIIQGPTGSGKSSLIAAIASELNCKILEVNTGDFRNASSLRQKLSGAGESQRIPSKSISSFFTKNDASKIKSKRQKTIIVVEDVDVSFQKLDKDFYPTLKSLAAESRVPVIWTCTQIPYEEIRREPSISYQLVCLPKMDKSAVLNYSSVCILGLTNSYLKWKSLKSSFSKNNIRLDIRALLSELQFSLADPSLPINVSNREYPKYQRDYSYNAPSTYCDYDSFMEDKRLEHPHVMGSFMPFDDRSFSRKAELVRKLMESVNVFSFRDLTCDYLPILTQIDFYDSLKSKGNRRHLHYFSEVKGEYPIDRDGKLSENIRHFRLEKL